MKNYGIKIILSALFLAITALNQIHAAVAIGTNQPVTILETFQQTTDYSYGTETKGEFTVINNSSSDIYAFFVANNTAHQADKTYNEFDSVTGSPILESWNPTVITRADWESGNINFPESNPFLEVWTPPDTTQISWDDTFGPNATKAFGYWTDGFFEVAQRAILSGETVSGFLFYSLVPNSPAVAFGKDGDIVALGHTTVVPLPGTIWLFSFGLVFLGRFKAKKASTI